MCYTYAGPHAPQVRNAWTKRGLWHQLLAGTGYLVFVCDNRSASGKGRASASACYRDLGTGELRDLEAGVDWLVREGHADPARIGIWGWSYGGYQTAFCLTHSDKWRLGIAVNPVTDWRLYDTIYTERYMGLPRDNPAGYARASVLNAAANLHGDFLLIHATMDDNVHLQNSLQLVHALQSASIQFRFMAYPRARHGIENEQQQRHLYTLMTEFVEEHL
jgi:dipeptidyl-peptidase-4